ncbi:SGNH/GDSL hydrolase family protein [Moraxella sp. RCAD0137]|uniref:SGNH/GDSL hydrolase family protein n=1 Tax=Moraxella sp. RCAD0137 TaxID=1775913 RepID=UPI000C9FE6D5|nr:SGNH/GDSL hydrolase family protein [Moraxella sp. RCAD0137]PNP97629.1 hypothetical protein AZ602_06340 [Moraxella sp. RCAD0137]
MKRAIKLREHGILASQIVNPSEKYAESKRHLSHRYAYQIQTDELGFIYSGRDFKPVNSVCFIGDSFVENKFVDCESRWHSVLEKLFLENGNKIRVLNAGYSGATSLNILNTIINKVVNSNVRTLIYVLSSNDYGALRYHEGYWNKTKNHSNLLLSEYVEEERGKPNKDMFRAMLKSIYDLSRNFGMELYFSTYPNLCDNKALMELNDWLREFCDENDYPLVDMDLLMQPYVEQGQELFHDKLHMNEKASKIFSEIIYDNLFKNRYTIQKNLLQQISVNKTESDSWRCVLRNQNFNSSIYTSVSVIIDINNHGLFADRLLIQLTSSNPINGGLHNNLLFSEELGWHIWVNIPKFEHLQIRTGFNIQMVEDLNINMCLESKSNIAEVIHDIYVEYII